MNDTRFDTLTELIARATSRRSLLTYSIPGTLGAVLGWLGGSVAPSDTDDAMARRRNKTKRKKAKRKNGRAREKKRGGKRMICHCGTSDPQSCTTIQVSKKAAQKHLTRHCDYSSACDGRVPPCGSRCTGQQTRCGGRCVNLSRDFANCGACGTACDAASDTCTGGSCTCGGSPPCTGGHVCIDGACVCGAGPGTCTVTPSRLGGWIDDSEGNASIAFVAGPETPSSGTGSLQLTTRDDVSTAALTNPAYEDLPLAAINTLSYSTFIADGVSPDLVPAFRLPVLYAGGTAFTTLVFEPSQSDELPDVEHGTWQRWDLLSAEARWRSSRDIPDSNPTIFEDTSFVSWDAILAAIPDAVILGGLHLEVGGGVVGAGHVDQLELNGAVFDFEADA